MIDKKISYFTLEELEQRFPNEDLNFLDTQHPHSIEFKSPYGGIEFVVPLARDKSKKIEVIEWSF